MINLTTIQALSDELSKIAELSYRSVSTNGQQVDLARGIPLIQSLPKDSTKMKDRISKIIESKKGQPVLGHHNVAIRRSSIKSLPDLGFKQTRLSVPLPGEKWLTPSWRSGRLHIHDTGPLFLAHLDKKEPKGFKAIPHIIQEGLPATIKRIGQREPLIKIKDQL